MRRPAILGLAFILMLALSGCGAAATATPAPTAAPSRAASAAPASAAAPAGTPASAGGSLRKVTIGLGYIPDIQFAPFYVARERGYFRDAGIDVEFKQGFDVNVLQLLGTNALGFGVVGGDELLVARSQGVPIVYVGSWFQKYPISVVALESANIRTVADLKGRTVGVPMRSGATYVGLRALLEGAGMKESDVQIREVGFTQVQALTQKQVDAVVGYANNEPVQLRALGQAITTINVFDSVNLISNGMIASEKTLKEDPELVRAVVAAMIKGVQDVIAKPDEAVTLCIPYIPGSSEKRAQLRAVLDATIPLFQSPTATQNGLGYNDPAAWQSSADLLRKLGVLGSEVDVRKSFTNDYLPKR